MNATLVNSTTAAIFSLFLTYVPLALGADAQVIDVNLGSYYIKPDKITVKVGRPVTLSITNEATMIPHNVVIKAPEAGIDVKVDLSGGKKGSVTFTPTKAGRYEMICDKKMVLMKSHQDKGMKAVLEVVE